jgi:dihydromethanopterin reductase
MQNVRAMCAIGQRGQLGLDGAMPWEGNRGAVFVADVERFFAMTKGHVLMAGPRTIASVPGFARADRTLVVIRSSDRPEGMIAQFPNRTIFIGGGPPVWAAYAHLIDNWDITRLPYDGPADRWFDPAWLVGRDASSFDVTSLG